MKPSTPAGARLRLVPSPALAREPVIPDDAIRVVLDRPCKSTKMPSDHGSGPCGS